MRRWVPIQAASMKPGSPGVSMTRLGRKRRGSKSARGVGRAQPCQRRRGDEVEGAVVEEASRWRTAGGDGRTGGVGEGGGTQAVGDSSPVIGNGPLQPPAVFWWGVRQDDAAAQQCGQPCVQVRATGGQLGSVRESHGDGQVVGHSAAAGEQRAPLAEVLGAADRARLVEDGCHPVSPQPSFGDHRGGRCLSQHGLHRVSVQGFDGAHGLVAFLSSRRCGRGRIRAGSRRRGPRRRWCPARSRCPVRPDACHAPSRSSSTRAASAAAPAGTH